MTRQDKLRRLRRKRCDVRGNIIASDMSMDDVDLLLTREFGYLHRTQNAEGVSDRNWEDVLRREEVETMPPVARRPKRNEHVVAALLQAPAQIHDMSLGTAVIPGR